MGILDGQQMGDFRDALVDAFPMPVRMNQVLQLRFKPKKNLFAISATGNINDDYFNLIWTAESEGWTMDLLRATREANPGNAMLLAFSQQFDLASTRKSQQELELIINQGIDFLDVFTWRETLGLIEAQICRIEVPLINGNIGNGTGFLVGPDTVLTNYHVIHPVKLDLANAADIILRFDYKKINTIEVNTGTEYKLLADPEKWLVASSPYSVADTKDAPPGAEPGVNELDYALLRLAEPAGNHTVGKVADPGSEPRNWLTLPDKQIVPELTEPLLILQHPSGDPLKLALDTNPEAEMVFDNRRLRYSTNTLPGSSGSPVFNFNFKLVALHHAGDPLYDIKANVPAKFNQGIPIALVHADLAQKEVLDSQGQIPARK